MLSDARRSTALGSFRTRPAPASNWLAQSISAITYNLTLLLRAEQLEGAAEVRPLRHETSNVSRRWISTQQRRTHAWSIPASMTRSTGGEVLVGRGSF